MSPPIKDKAKYFFKEKIDLRSHDKIDLRSHDKIAKGGENGNREGIEPTGLYLRGVRLTNYTNLSMR